MDTLHPHLRDLARRLVALEATRDRPLDRRADGAVRVCEELRAIVSRLVGDAGFRSLLSRALAQARAEAPSLDDVRIGTDGSLEGLDRIASAEDGGVALVARLLGLLALFVGPSMTSRLVRDGWPDALGDGFDLNIGEMS